METGSARTFYYEVKYGQEDFYHITKDNTSQPIPYKHYKYIALFKVESCWNIEDGREAVKNWCIENIENYNKIDGNCVRNSIIYEIHKNYYENYNYKYALTKDVKYIDLKGTYVKPKEIDYKYNPTEDQMNVTNNFFENIDNTISLWNTTPNTVLYETDAISTAANKTTLNTTTVNNLTITNKTKLNTTSVNNLTIANKTEWDLTNNNENNTKLYNDYSGTTIHDNTITYLLDTFESNGNQPKYSKDNKEYENLMLM